MTSPPRSTHASLGYMVDYLAKFLAIKTFFLLSCRSPQCSTLSHSL